MSVTTFEGIVKSGQIRLAESAVLPEETRVYVVVPGSPLRPSGVWSPRLADRRQAGEFVMELVESPEGKPDAGV